MSSVLQNELEVYKTELKRRFPFVFSEIDGISSGCGFDFDTVFVSVYRKEFLASLDSRGCTDVHGWSDEFVGWVHNEDYGWPFDFRPIVMVEAERVTISDSREETVELRWLATCYPLCLCGMTVGCVWSEREQRGLVFSVENLTPIEVAKTDSVASQVLCRSALESVTFDHFISIVANHSLATGRGFTVGHWSFLASESTPTEIAFVETGPRGQCDVKKIFPGAIQSGTDCHTNHYLRLDLAQKVGPSSTGRLERYETLRDSQFFAPRPDLRDRLLEAASDEQGDWPVYRTGRNPDKGFTVFSALIDFSSIVGSSTEEHGPCEAKGEANVRDRRGNDGPEVRIYWGKPWVGDREGAILHKFIVGSKGPWIAENS